MTRNLPVPLHYDRIARLWWEHAKRTAHLRVWSRQIGEAGMAMAAVTIEAFAKTILLRDSER